MTGYNSTVKRSNPNVLPLPLAGKLLAAVAVAMLVMALLNHAFAATFPRTDIMVHSQNIKLGDVFEGAIENADFVLAPAPRPGEELVWNAPTLLRIATAFNLPWRPKSEDRISIRRAATLVDADTVRAVLRDHLSTLNNRDSFNLSLSTTIPEIIVPSLDMPQIQVADFNMPASGGPFSAIIKVGTGKDKSQTVTLRGMAERMVHVPVLKRSIKNGNIINAADIEWVTYAATSVPRHALLDTDTMIGATPRRLITAGNVIKADDLEMPKMVSRGDVVMMVYQKDGMYLTAKGRALEDGLSGQTIKVSNMGSNRQIQARVTANNQVTVH